MFTKISGLFLPRNSIVKRIPMRYNTTNQPPNPTPNANQAATPPTPNPTASAPKPTPSTGAAGKEAPGKGKGPITWKSLSFVLVGGSGLMVITNLFMIHLL